MQETFKSTSQEFRDVCYMLLGYRIDRIKPKLYRLSSMYAESPNDHLLFEVCRTTELPFTFTEDCMGDEVFVAMKTYIKSVPS